MAKSSLDYTEQMGLTIALSNLESSIDKELSGDPAAYNGDSLIVMDWLKKRIKTLSNK